jgi:hypothetical protein
MPPFLVPFWTLTQCQNFRPSQTCFFTNTIHAYLYEMIWLWEWLWLELPYPTNQNANMYSLNFPCFYLQFNQKCRNPTLAKCGGEAQHLEKLKVGSLSGLLNVQSSTTRPKTPCIGVFLVSLERSWNVDIENALALAIRTSTAQVMGKRRAGSQTGNLTPDH